MFYEVRLDPDDLGVIFTTLTAARKYARARAEARGNGPYLIYLITDQFETYLEMAG